MNVNSLQNGISLEKCCKTMDDYVPTGEKYGPADYPIFMKRGKRYIKVANRKGVRYLIVPEICQGDVVVNVNSTEMLRTEWDRIISKTKTPTMNQKKQMAEDYVKNRNLKHVEVNKRKKEMQIFMAEAGKSVKLNDLQREKEFRRKYTIDRAQQMLLEDEEPMKEFNRLVAMKKSIATWDQQILEKLKRKEDEKKENLRWEREEELKRRQRVKEAEIERQKENSDKQNFIRALGEQIKEREITNKLKMEMKQLEREKFNRAALQTEIDELKAFQQKVKDDEQLRVEQRRVNVLLQRIQAIDREEDRLFYEKQQSTKAELQRKIDERVSEKRDLEMKWKEELQKMADEKSKAEEEAKLKDLMEETLRVDNTERTWRQRQLLETQEKKVKLEEMFNQLEKQVDGRRIAKAQAIEEERREVCKVAKENVEDEIKDREAERKMKLASEIQRMEILMQINDIDRRKLLDREDKELEVNFNKIMEEKKVEQTRRGMWRKINQIRKDQLPEKYVLDIENFVKVKYGERK